MLARYPERYVDRPDDPKKVMLQRWEKKEYLAPIMPPVAESMPSSRQKVDEPIEVEFPNE
jgi:hypothetical protein